MKLKLSERDGIKILEVAESLLAQEVPILRAGISKILHSDAPGLIADLRGVRTDGAQVALLRADADTLPTPLLILSTEAGQADIQTVEEGLSRLNSPLKRLMTREAQLKFRLGAALLKKKELESGLASQTSGWAEFLKLKNRSSKLQIECALLAGLLASFVGAGKMNQKTVRPPVPRAALLNQVIKGVLSSQGVLKGA